MDKDKMERLANWLANDPGLDSAIKNSIEEFCEVTNTMLYAGEFTVLIILKPEEN